MLELKDDNRILISSQDWDSAWDSALDGVLDSAWDSARAS